MYCNPIAKGCTAIGSLVFIIGFVSIILAWNNAGSEAQAALDAVSKIKAEELYPKDPQEHFEKKCVKSKLPGILWRVVYDAGEGRSPCDEGRPMSGSGKINITYTALDGSSSIKSFGDCKDPITFSSDNGDRVLMSFGEYSEKICDRTGTYRLSAPIKVQVVDVQKRVMAGVAHVGDSLWALLGTCLAYSLLCVGFTLFFIGGFVALMSTDPTSHAREFHEFVESPPLVMCSDSKFASTA